MSAHVTALPLHFFPCVCGAAVADTDHLVACQAFGGPFALGPGSRAPRPEETRLAVVFVPRPPP
eukprot:13266932-Alexandrium_andersonii.AAC.1